MTAGVAWSSPRSGEHLSRQSGGDEPGQIDWIVAEFPAGESNSNGETGRELAAPA